MKPKGGQPPIATVPEVQNFIASFPEGKVIDQKAVAEWLDEKIKERYESEGRFHDPDATHYSAKIAKHYLSLIAQLSPGALVTTKIKAKTEVREAGERSDRPAAAFAATAAVEHFRPGGLPPSFPAASQLKHAAEGAKIMYGLAPNALGGIPAHPAKPQSLHSAGGSGAWLARPRKEGGSSWVVPSRSEAEN